VGPPPVSSASRGSRTAGYVVPAALATIPGFLVLIAFSGANVAIGAVVVLWTSGIVWLLKKRPEEPGWDRRPTSGLR